MTAIILNEFTELKIGLLNLMPDKEVTQRQFDKVLQNSDKKIALVPLRMATHISKTHNVNYLEAKYEIATLNVLDRLDGLIVTGSPIEHLEFSQIDFWDELTGILNHIRQINLATLFVCWSAQAALFHYYGIQKRCLDNKAFGVFPQWKINASSPLTAGIEDIFFTPISRHTTIDPLDLLRRPELELIAGSDFSGPGMVSDLQSDFTYMFNHLEYEIDTLHTEYIRDKARGRVISAPVNCYSSYGMFPSLVNTWSNTAIHFFNNWAIQAQQSSITRNSLQTCIGFAA